jgi:hypothetical protein
MTTPDSCKGVNDVLRLGWWGVSQMGAGGVWVGVSLCLNGYPHR